MDLPSGASLLKSYFPISKNRPSNPRQRMEACNLSSASEFKTTSTPCPSVSFIIICSNDVSREFPIFRSFSFGNLSIKNARFSGVPTVVNTRQPICKAIAMAAWPTPPVPAWMRTDSPG